VYQESAAGAASLGYISAFVPSYSGSVQTERVQLYALVPATVAGTGLCSHTAHLHKLVQFDVDAGIAEVHDDQDDGNDEAEEAKRRQQRRAAVCRSRGWAAQYGADGEPVEQPSSEQDEAEDHVP